MKLFQPRLSSRLSIAPQIAVVALVVGLAGVMAIEPTRQIFQQRSRIAEMSHELKAIEKSNEHLRNMVTRLQDPDYLEQQAREQSGLVRPGEKSIIVMPPAGSEPRDKEKDKSTSGGGSGDKESGVLDSMLNFLGFG